VLLKVSRHAQRLRRVEAGALAPAAHRSGDALNAEAIPEYIN